MTRGARYDKTMIANWMDFVNDGQGGCYLVMEVQEQTGCTLQRVHLKPKQALYLVESIAAIVRLNLGDYKNET